MTTEALLLLLLLIGLTVAFIVDRFPPLAVALFGLMALVALDILDLRRALSGLANEATVTVAGLFILCSGLQQSGGLAWPGALFERYGTSRWRLMLLIILVVGPLSAFVNNTAAVAVFLPIVLAACVRHGLPRTQFLMPLSYIAQIGGVCTLMGTSTNLLVSGAAVHAGLPPISFFGPTPVGVPLFVLGALFLLLIYPLLGVGRRIAGPVDRVNDAAEFVTEQTLRGDDARIGQGTATALPSGVRTISAYGANDGAALAPDTPLAPNDRLRYFGAADAILRLRAGAPGAVPVEALLTTDSRFHGASIADLAEHLHGLADVVAVGSREHLPEAPLARHRMTAGDSVLLRVSPADIPILSRHPELTLLRSAAVDDRRPDRSYALRALAITVAVVLLAVVEMLPLALGVILGAAAMIGSRVMSFENAMTAVDWRVVLLLAFMIPLGLAMEQTGLARLLVDGMLLLVPRDQPWLALLMLYLLTMVLTEIMSNNATAVLLTPIAISTADAMGVSALPFLIAVLVAASTAFATPIGYQTNTMVYNVGGYRFNDFLRAGLPLNLLFMVGACLLIPRFYPF